MHRQTVPLSRLLWHLMTLDDVCKSTNSCLLTSLYVVPKIEICSFSGGISTEPGAYLLDHAVRTACCLAITKVHIFLLHTTLKRKLLLSIATKTTLMKSDLRYFHTQHQQWFQQRPRRWQPKRILYLLSRGNEDTFSLFRFSAVVHLTAPRICTPRSSLLLKDHQLSNRRHFLQDFLKRYYDRYYLYDLSKFAETTTTFLRPMPEKSSQLVCTVAKSVYFIFSNSSMRLRS